MTLGQVILQGTAASMPAPSIPGRLYFTTDSPQQVFTDTGSAWVNVTPESTQPSGSANQFLATPNGSSGQAALRAILPADLPLATISAPGVVRPDGTTITISGGVISAVGSGGGSGTGSLVNLGSVTLNAASATMSFSSIPGTYRALKLILQTQIGGATQEPLQISFNGDNGANYSNAQMIGGAGTFNAATTGGTYGIVGASVQAGTYPNDATACEVMIPGYASAFYKTFKAHSSYRDSFNSGKIVVREDGNTWLSTAAITSITLTPSGGAQLQPGSSATLYGMN